MAREGSPCAPAHLATLGRSASMRTAEEIKRAEGSEEFLLFSCAESRYPRRVT